MSKLTDEQRQELKKAEGDWESYHSIRDVIMEKRLLELDKEFIIDLNIETENGVFWYA